jgi:hypothetical protein
MNGSVGSLAPSEEHYYQREKVKKKMSLHDEEKEVLTIMWA